jgi:integrase
MQSRWLTDAVVRDLRVPQQGVEVTYDAPDPNNKRGWASGFGVRVSSGGARSFVLNYRVKATQRERRITIGSWPTWNVKAARAEAFELKLRIAKGEDPLALIQASRDAPTVAQLCDRFVAEHVPKRRPATQRDYRSIIGVIREALGRKLVTAVDHKDVEDLHAEITKRAPHRANRVVAVLSRMFTLAIKWRMRPDNPAKGVERNPEAKRKRYATRDELARLTRALAGHDDQRMANAFRMMLLTGARKGEVLSATWDQFDFGRNVWRKPAATTKQKTEHEVPLGGAALELLKGMRKAAPDGAYLFPSHGRTGHLTEVKKAWAAICERAGIIGLRMHDIRHSYASLLASAGYSLPTIGALLGHTQPQTTARYAHLLDDPLREATNKVGAIMGGLVTKQPAKGKKPLKVVAGGKQ